MIIGASMVNLRELQRAESPGEAFPLTRITSLSGRRLPRIAVKFVQLLDFMVSFTSNLFVLAVLLSAWPRLSIFPVNSHVKSANGCG